MCWHVFRLLNTLVNVIRRLCLYKKAEKMDVDHFLVALAFQCMIEINVSTSGVSDDHFSAILSPPPCKATVLNELRQ